MKTSPWVLKKAFAFFGVIFFTGVFASQVFAADLKDTEPSPFIGFISVAIADPIKDFFNTNVLTPVSGLIQYEVSSLSNSGWSLAGNIKGVFNPNVKIAIFEAGAETFSGITKALTFSFYNPDDVSTRISREISISRDGAMKAVTNFSNVASKSEILNKVGTAFSKTLAEVAYPFKYAFNAIDLRK